MADKRETKETLAAAKAHFETALKMVEALQKISEQADGQLIGPQNQDGKSITQYLFAAGIIALAYTALDEGKHKASYFNESCFHYPKELTDRLFDENAAISRLKLSLEFTMKYIAKANLPDPYSSEGVDIVDVAKRVSEESSLITRIICTIDKLLAT